MINLWLGYKPLKFDQGAAAVPLWEMLVSDPIWNVRADMR